MTKSLSFISSDPSCSNKSAVRKIAYQSPGDAIINDKTLILFDLPPTFTGTDAKKLVSFTLEPVFDISGTKLKVVCVTDIHDAVKKSSINNN